ncbi:MAG: sigma-54-dependent Fis family transcriptional regulator, partial [Deltaproteobacteria bacterium]|nr:sigma-54-dependent Fis family transcriptional regulator [Deltaproteobacteria bacterium]
YYRINVINIHIPPLRERKEDIPLLMNHFLEKYSQETAKRVDHISRDTIEQLKRYDWPGNVRELENAIERAVVLSKSRTLKTEDFAFLHASPAPRSGTMSLKEVEIEYIREVLADSDWNITRAAKVLDLNRVTLHKKINRYNLKRDA